MNDLISRQAAIEEVETRLKAAYVWYDNSVLKDDYALSVKAEGAISAFIECVLMLKGLPDEEPERKKGKWTSENACEFCGFQPWYERDIHTLSYCPNCGADMREREGEA